jgi:hypothetical protein
MDAWLYSMGLLGMSVENRVEFRSCYGVRSSRRYENVILTKLVQPVAASKLGEAPYWVDAQACKEV